MEVRAYWNDSNYSTKKEWDVMGGNPECLKDCKEKDYDKVREILEQRYSGDIILVFEYGQYK